MCPVTRPGTNPDFPIFADKPYIRLDIGGSDDVSALYDTGAATSLIDSKLFAAAQKAGRVRKKFPRSDIQLVGAGGDPLNTDGAYTIDCNVFGMPYTLTFVLVPDLPSNCIIGMNNILPMSMMYDPKESRFGLPAPGRPTTRWHKAEVRVVSQIKIPAQEGILTRCKLVNEDGSRVPAGHQFVATIHGIPFVAETDCSQSFLAYIANPTEEMTCITRADVLGEAEPGTFCVPSKYYFLEL